MENSKSIESSGAFGIPKWIMKKGMRYEVDDFIVSPPSNDDEGFMRLRFGCCPTPHRQLAPHEGAQTDRGMTVEVRDIVSVTGGGQESNAGPTITFSPAVLSTPETSPTSTPATPPNVIINNPNTHPLSQEASFVREGTKKPLVNDKNSENLYATNISTESHQQTESSSTIVVQTLRKISSTRRPCLENLIREEEGKDFAVPEEKPLSSILKKTPEPTPDPTPKSSPMIQRKVLGVAMENNPRKISAHSYFCTRPFQVQGTSDSSVSMSTSEEGTLSLDSSNSSRKIDDATLSSLNLEANTKFMGKKRQRPKPSTLREMNFWAPTSM